MKKREIDFPKAVKQLEVTTKRLISSQFIGNYKSVFKGTGLEFADYRQYSPGDDANLIDWKASAKADKLLIKEFVEERSLNMFFLVDASTKMIFGSTPLLKFEYVTQLVSALAYANLQVGDQIGLGLFTDKLTNKTTIQGGPKQFYIVRKLLVDTNNYGGKFDLENPIKSLYNYLDSSSLLFIISDFIGWKKSWENVIRAAGTRFDLIGVMVRDPRDNTLPQGYNVVLEGPNAEYKTIINSDEIKSKYSKIANEQQKTVKNAFLKSNADFISLQTDKSFIGPLQNLFIRRKQRWR